MKKLIIHSKKHGDYTVLYDDEDHDKVSKYTWTLSLKHKSTIYAYTTYMDKGFKKQLKLHHLIIGRKNGMVTDHIDGNGLNNQKSNLRFATIRQNLCNKSIQRNNTTGYKGVHWHKAAKKYMVHFKENGKLIYGGLYIDIIEAAKKYNELALKHYGDFAKLNTIP